MDRDLNCSGGGGPTSSTQGFSSCGNIVAGPPWVNNPSAITRWVFGRWVQRVNQFSPNSVYQAGYRITAKPGAYARAGQVGFSPLPDHLPAGMPNHPRAAPRIPPRIPRGLVPYVPNGIGRDVGNGGSQNPGPGTQNPGVNPLNPTNPGPGTQPGVHPGLDPHNPRPPGRNERERKGRAPESVVRALGIANEALEAVELVDALWEALPKEVREATPKTARTRKGAIIGRDRPYSSAYDKALHLWRNLDKLDIEQAVLNVIKNYIEDMILGRINAGADRFSNRYLGGARQLNIS